MFEYKCTKCKKKEELSFKLSKRLADTHLCDKCKPKKEIECPGISIPDSFNATKNFGEPQ
jgi:DNA-directed RNA polymerase subunit RPC12/RpoP